jgi:cytochrome b involved in lipid metabolism
MTTDTELTSDKKVISLEDCEKHTAEEDCWLVIHGKVYDVTEMLDEHPGGGDILVSASGRASILSGFHCLQF